MTALNSIALALFLLLVGTAQAAGFGELRGPLIFNVTAGHSQTLLWTLTDSSNQSYNFTAYSNSSLIAISPDNGTIGPYTELPLNVTVSVPANETNGTINAYAAASIAPVDMGMLTVEQETEKRIVVNVAAQTGGSAAVEEGSAAIALMAIAAGYIYRRCRGR